jgi:hypothetical protein
MRLFRVLLVACIVCVFGALPAAQAGSSSQVTVSKRAASLPGPRYRWIDMPAQRAEEQAAPVRDAHFRAELQAALDKALHAKGYRLAEAGAKPDFIVGYRVGVRRLEETTVHDLPGGSEATPQATIRCSMGDCSQIAEMGPEGAPVVKLESAMRTEGGLLVEVIEPGTIRVLWRALNRGTVKPGKVTPTRLEKVANDTLRSLPAAPKAASP